MFNKTKIFDIKYEGTLKTYVIAKMTKFLFGRYSTLQTSETSQFLKL